jgi:CubicO group peptidase (beta-lactamase class C family)
MIVRVATSASANDAQPGRRLLRTASALAVECLSLPLEVGREEDAMVDARASERMGGVLADLVASGAELGLQLAAYRRGELVVDTWAGVSDRMSGRPVDGDTLFTVFSTSKGIAATCAHLLAERGQLDYDAPIARYWPEFAQNGKARATVRDALSHRVGVPRLPAGVTPEQLCDWDGMCAFLAAEAPAWEPGTRSGYHALTYGWLVGELVRRADGRPIAELVRDELCRPLGSPDFYFGIPDAVEPRVATLEWAPEPPAVTPEPGSLLERAIPDGSLDWFNRPDVRRAAIPGGGGITSARWLARHYAALIGPVDGVRLLPAERVAAATRLQTEEIDLVAGGVPRRALGYGLGGLPDSPLGPRATAFGHGGAGGSLGFADPERGLAVGFTKTLLTRVVDPSKSHTLHVMDRLREALGVS